MVILEELVCVCVLDMGRVWGWWWECLWISEHRHVIAQSCSYRNLPLLPVPWVPTKKAWVPCLCP